MKFDKLFEAIMNDIEDYEIDELGAGFPGANKLENMYIEDEWEFESDYPEMKAQIEKQLADDGLTTWDFDNMSYGKDENGKDAYIVVYHSDLDVHEDLTFYFTPEMKMY